MAEGLEVPPAEAGAALREGAGGRLSAQAGRQDLGVPEVPEAPEVRQSLREDRREDRLEHRPVGREDHAGVLEVGQRRCPPRGQQGRR